jgi:hypothetical protein
MSSVKRRVNIYVNEAQWSLLQRLRERTGAPAAESVRRAIDAYLAEQFSKEELSAARKDAPHAGGAGTARKR